MKKFNIGDKFLLEELPEILGKQVKFEFPKSREKKLFFARKALENLLKSGKIIYGINTGFGQLASEVVSSENLDKLQLNLIRSHACGVGEPLSDLESRALLFIRAGELARGHSGVRPVLVKTMVDF
ncbi:MAG: aromatic amino acid lyase, partial [Elusimicrobia bacterium]|nr:aromatic amino acid lyase [Elusimicrobiota bacterium]